METTNFKRSYTRGTYVVTQGSVGLIDGIKEAIIGLTVIITRRLLRRGIVVDLSSDDHL